MEGLKTKYIIEEADGSPIHPEAKFFVLRYDKHMKDKVFLYNARIALLQFCTAMMGTNPKLAHELSNEIMNEVDEEMNP